MATKPVKWFDNSMAGAPTLTGAAGSLIAVLDACLVNGFNLMTLDSLVVSGGVLIGTKAGHGFVVDQVIVTAGANEAPLNGEWAVTEVTTSTFKATATGISNVTGTGTITAKAAPAGWSKVYSGTNKAAYKSSSAEGTGCFLRVDDTNAQYAVVFGFESMTDVDTGVNRFPTVIQAPSGLGWGKSATAGSTTRPWAVVVDDRIFYFFRSPNSANSTSQLHVFGDVVSDRVSGDPFSCIISGHVTPNVTSGAIPCGIAATDGYNSGDIVAVARSHTQIGNSALCGVYSLRISTNNQSGELSSAKTLSPLNNKAQLTPPVLTEVTTNVIRASKIPGFFHTVSYIPFLHLDRTSNVMGVNGRKVLACASSYGGSEGRVFFDITGPWR